MNRRFLLKGLVALAAFLSAPLAAAAKAKAARRPLVFGRVLNVEPAAMGSLTYQVHDGSILAIEAIRDGGMELRIERDHPTMALLASSEPSPGCVHTCVSEGAFKLGAAPVFPVTVDVVGENLRSSVTRTDELAGAVQSGFYSREWRDEIDAKGLLVHVEA